MLGKESGEGEGGDFGGGPKAKVYLSRTSDGGDFQGRKGLLKAKGVAF